MDQADPTWENKQLPLKSLLETVSLNSHTGALNPG